MKSYHSKLEKCMLYALACGTDTPLLGMTAFAHFA